MPRVDVPLLRTVTPWLTKHPGLTKTQVEIALAQLLPREFSDLIKSVFSFPLRNWLMGDLTEIKERSYRGWARYPLNNHTA